MQGHVPGPTFQFLTILQWAFGVAKQPLSIHKVPQTPTIPLTVNLLPIQPRRESQEKHCTHSHLHSAQLPASVPQTPLPHSYEDTCYAPS